MTVSIRIEGLDELNKKLGRITARDSLKPAMARSLERLKDGLVKYPAPVAPGGGWVSRMTPKARGYFFWALRSGLLSVPYKRTMKLGQSWTSKIENVGGSLGMRGIVGNSREAYNRFVQDETGQAAIHKGRWPTVQSVAKAERDRIVKDFQDEIHRLVNK